MPSSATEAIAKHPALAEAAIQELQAQLQSQWQPIETVPRDSRARLVWCPDRQNIYAVSYQGRRGWLIFGGGVLTQEPTHWMPLPPPPSPEGAT